MLWRLTVLTCETQLVMPVFAIVQLIAQQIVGPTYLWVAVAVGEISALIICLKPRARGRGECRQSARLDIHSPSCSSARWQDLRVRPAVCHRQVRSCGVEADALDTDSSLPLSREKISQEHTSRVHHDLSGPSGKVTRRLTPALTHR